MLAASLDCMRIDTTSHLQHGWRVHTLAADFELLDVWELAVDGPSDLARLIELMSAHGLEGKDDRIVGALVSLRKLLGRWFGWDREEERPIPGCTETTLAERLSAE